MNKKTQKRKRKINPQRNTKRKNIKAQTKRIKKDKKTNI